MLMTLTMTVTLAAMIAICGVILQQLVICFTPPSLTWLVYVAGVPAILGICITTVCRSLITKVKHLHFFDSLSLTITHCPAQCVQPWEIGTVFSVVGALQAMMPLLASPMYGFLYKRTLATLPGAFLLLNVGLYVVVMFLVLWVYTRMRSTGVVGADMELTHGEELVGVRKSINIKY